MTDITIKKSASTPLSALLSIFEQHGDAVGTDGKGGIVVAGRRPRLRAVPSREAESDNVLDMRGMLKAGGTTVDDDLPGAA